jgi:phosphoinositide-3-kinase regulatory subunit
VNHCIIFQTVHGFGFVESYAIFESLKSLVLHYAQNSLENYNDSLSTTLAYPIFGTSLKQTLLPPNEKVKQKTKHDKDKQKQSEKQERVQDQMKRQEQSQQDSDRESRQQDQIKVSGMGGYVLTQPR